MDIFIILVLPFHKHGIALPSLTPLCEYTPPPLWLHQIHWTHSEYSLFLNIHLIFSKIIPIFLLQAQKSFFLQGSCQSLLFTFNPLFSHDSSCLYHTASMPSFIPQMMYYLPNKVQSVWTGHIISFFPHWWSGCACNRNSVSEWVHKSLSLKWFLQDERC